MLSLHAQAHAVVLGHERMDAAGVVAEHSAERAVAVGFRIGGEVQLVLFDRAVAQIVEDAARLNPRQLACRVDLQHVVHVLREVHHDRDVAALPGEAGPAAAARGSARRIAGASVMVASTSSTCAG